MKAMVFTALISLTQPVSAESLADTLNAVVASPCPPTAAWAEEEAQLKVLLFQVRQGFKVANRKRGATDVAHVQDIWGAVASELAQAERQLNARIANCG